MTTTTGVTTGVTIGMTTAGPAPRTARYATAVPPGRSTAELLEAARGGSGSAWQLLIERHERVVWATARSFRLQEDDVRDVVQTTWLLLLENLQAIHDPERLGGWLATTASRECLRLLRRTRSIAVDSDALVELADPGSGPEERTVDSCIHEELRSAVDELAPRTKVLVRALFAEQQLPYVEVARTTGRPIGSLGPSRARALRQLRVRLADRGIDAGR